MKVICVKIYEKDYENMEFVTKAMNITLSEFVRKAIAFCIKNIKECLASGNE